MVTADTVDLSSKELRKVVRKKKNGKARQEPATDLVKPRALGKARVVEPNIEKSGPVQLGGVNYRSWMEEQKMEAMMQRIAEGTRSGYEVGWKQWVLFQKGKKASPLLEGGSRRQRREGGASRR